MFHDIEALRKWLADPDTDERAVEHVFTMVEKMKLALPEPDDKPAIELQDAIHMMLYAIEANEPRTVIAEHQAEAFKALDAVDVFVSAWLAAYQSQA